jgi:hypothetical protein
MQFGTVRSFLTERKVRTESSHRLDQWWLDSWASRRNIMSSRWMQGIQFFWLGICAESSRSIALKGRLLKKTESLIKSIITWKWFCPIECSQLQTNKLPLWPFWDKNTWPVKKYNPSPKQKILPLFVTKGQRIKQSIKKNYKKITPPKCLSRTRVNRVKNVQQQF